MNGVAISVECVGVVCWCCVLLLCVGVVCWCCVLVLILTQITILRLIEILQYLHSDNTYILILKYN